MAKAKNKTVATTLSVTDFIAAVADEKKRNDSQVLLEIMTRLSGQQPKMWGNSIIGFGDYHYKYDSGREGDFFRVGFSPRKANLAIYIISGFDQHTKIMAKLGKFKTGSSCLYIKRLSDIDLVPLEELITANMAYMAEKYPA